MNGSNKDLSAIENRSKKPKTATFNRPRQEALLSSRKSTSKIRPNHVNSKASKYKEKEEKLDWRTLSLETISSINWIKHCQIKMEHVPNKLKNCFFITKLNFNIRNK